METIAQLRALYNRGMLRGTVSLGRWWGVEVRVHVSLPLLFVAALVLGAIQTGNAMRGFGLFFALSLGLVVREGARLVAAAYAGMRVRALFLLPFGGIMALAPSTGGEEPSTRMVTAAAPAANVLAGVLLIGAAYAIDPRASMVAQPWISPAYVLRSTVWAQFLLAALSLLPAGSVPMRDVLRGRRNEAGARMPMSPLQLLGTFAGMGFFVTGIVGGSVALLVVGGVCLLSAQLANPATTATAGTADDLTVRDVMLTEYTVLNTSDTLEGALARTVHSLHDVFPVVRGNLLVGSVARGTLAARLRAEGDSYLQGTMSRSLEVVAPDETLVSALRRASGLGAGEFIPVADGARVVGILSPQNLARAVSQVRLRAARDTAAATRDDA